MLFSRLAAEMLKINKVELAKFPKEKRGVGLREPVCCKEDVVHNNEDNKARENPLMSSLFCFSLSIGKLIN